MKNYYYLLVSVLCFSFVDRMIGCQAIVIKNLSTKISIDGAPQELYAILRYPTQDFQKTNIINIVTHPMNSSQVTDGFQVSDDFKILDDVKAIKQGRLDSLTEDNIAAIANGYAAYHYAIKSVKKNGCNMDIGALVIDKQRHSDQKHTWRLEEEHNLICQAALVRKISKSKEVKSGYSIVQ